jgi:hypothetical protein
VETTVVTQPMSIATSKPSKSTKKLRVSAGLSDLMFGTALLIVTPHFYPKSAIGAESVGRTTPPPGLDPLRTGQESGNPGQSVGTNPW